MPEGVVEFFDGRAARFEVVQKLRPLIVDQSCVLPATSDHPLDRGHLPVKQRSWPRFAQRINHIGYALRFLYNWIEAGEMHGDERHLFENGAHAALGDLAVVVRGHALPVTRVAPFTYRIRAAHELGGVFRGAEFLERVGERRDAGFFILLAYRSRIALD